jgi:hypothetical protein
LVGSGPSCLRLLGCQVDQRADLVFVQRQWPGAISSQLLNQLSGSDDLVHVTLLVLPFLAVGGGFMLIAEH